MSHADRVNELSKRNGGSRRVKIKHAWYNRTMGWMGVNMRGKPLERSGQRNEIRPSVMAYVFNSNTQTGAGKSELGSSQGYIVRP